jgi:hypothetical protein
MEAVPGNNPDDAERRGEEEGPVPAGAHQRLPATSQPRRDRLDGGVPNDFGQDLRECP